MADIELVIKIPEEIYRARQHWVANQKRMIDKVDIAIANGTPLPKGHGDLIDRKELLKQPMDTANYPSNYVHVAYTIIPADKYCDANPYEKYDMVDPQESEE